jgi:hypothetical protein
VARENGFGTTGSFAWSTLCSGLWETFGEWREYGSINDMLETSTSGLPLGETVHQIVHHLGETRFELYSGMIDHVEARNSRTLALAGLRADLDRLARGGRHVELAAELPVDGTGMRERDVVARTSLAGVDRHGRGYDLFAGTGSTFVYHQVMERPGDARPDNTWDLFTTVGAGPRVELELHRAGLELRAGLDVQLDFAMLRSWAYDPWRAMHPDAVVRGSLQTNAHPYYYATGLSLAPRLTAEYRGFALGGEIGTSWFRSLDGHDRYASTLMDDPHLDDRDATAAGWVGYAHRGVAITLEARARQRVSAIGDVVAAHAEHTTVATLGYAW